MGVGLSCVYVCFPQPLLRYAIAATGELVTYYHTVKKKKHKHTIIQDICGTVL